MKTILLCAAAFIAVEASSVYDFSDPEFNGLLDDELLTWAEGKDKYIRTRRETDDDEERSAGLQFENDEVDDIGNGIPENSDFNEPSHHRHHCRRHHKSCCGKTPMPISIQPHQPHNRNSTMRSAGNECYDEVNAKLGNKTIENEMDLYSCEKVKRMKKRHICIQECGAKRQEVANEEGILDFPKVKELLTSRVNETWQKDLIGQAVDSCSTIKYDDTWKADTDEYKCNPQALQFKHCVWKNVETNCPKEYQSQNRHCKKLRTKLVPEKNTT